MALDGVPTYLTDGIRNSDPQRIQQALDEDDIAQISDSLMIAEELLGAWSDDASFWEEAAAEALPPDPPPQTDLEDALDQERELLAAALQGDHRLANAVLLEAPLESGPPEIERAKEVVVIIQIQCRQVLEEPPKRRKWRGAKVLRRVFKATGGGLLVAADIVAPDPTLLVKIASIWGGVDMIIDASRGERG